jgi:hypothetical protein
VSIAIGSFIGALLLIILGLLAWRYSRKRSRHKNRQHSSEPSNDSEEWPPARRIGVSFVRRQGSSHSLPTPTQQVTREDPSTIGNGIPGFSHPVSIGLRHGNGGDLEIGKEAQNVGMGVYEKGKGGESRSENVKFSSMTDTILSSTIASGSSPDPKGLGFGRYSSYDYGLKDKNGENDPDGFVPRSISVNTSNYELLLTGSDSEASGSALSSPSISSRTRTNQTTRLDVLAVPRKRERGKDFDPFLRPDGERRPESETIYENDASSSSQFSERDSKRLTGTGMAI